MDKLIEILEDIKPGVDYETCDTLIDDGLLDSFAILSIVSELQDEFDIAIAEEAYRNYRKNPKTYSHDEAWKEILG